MRCYLTFYPMLGQNIQYEFEPCEGDSVEIITVHDESTQNILDNEGKKCVATVQKDIKVRLGFCLLAHRGSFWLLSNFILFYLFFFHTCSLELPYMVAIIEILACSCLFNYLFTYLGPSLTNFWVGWNICSLTLNGSHH